MLALSVSAVNVLLLRGSGACPVSICSQRTSCLEVLVLALSEAAVSVLLMCMFWCVFCQ